MAQKITLFKPTIFCLTDHVKELFKKSFSSEKWKLYVFFMHKTFSSPDFIKHKIYRLT